jgi:hypothetical protein
LGALVERYDGDGVNDAPGSPRVAYFELYNEPDAYLTGVTERWGKHGAGYAAMLKAVYPVMKGANPNVQVVFGGIAHDFFTDQDLTDPTNNGPFIRTFFDDVLKAGAGPYFDVMNFHFYPVFGNIWTKRWPKDGPGLVEKTAAIRATMTKYNVNKPMIITEAAWHNNATIPFGSDVLQTRMVVQLFTQAIVADIAMMAWWPMGDASGSYMFDTGLVSNEGDGTTARKPAYYAYQVMQREMSGAKFVAKTATDASDVQAYRFEDSAHNRIVYIAWTNPTDPLTAWGISKPYTDTTRSTQIVVAGSQTTSYDAFWTKLTTNYDSVDGKSDGRVKVQINGDPRYIVIEGN